MLSYQVAEDQRYCSHVLQAVVTIGRIGQGADLGDDADRRLVGGDDDAIDFVQAIAHLRVQRHGSLTGRLRVEFGREADLEQHVLHDISAERLRETQRALVDGLERQVLVGMAERDIVKPHCDAVSTPGTPISPRMAISARRTPRLDASPAAHDLREPALGA